MVRSTSEMVVAEKCHRCKVKQQDKCEGQLIIKGARLVECPSFISDRSNTIVPCDVAPPFPVKKKKARGKKNV